MKWSEMSDKEKVRLLLTHVVPHEIADDIVIEQSTVVVKRRWTPEYHVKPVAWPVAAWDEALECWQVRDCGDNSSTIFDPLHDLDTAWKLTEQERFTSVSLERACMPSTDEKHTYLCGLSVERKWGYHVFGSTPQEAICLAALMACGVDVEP